MPCGALQTARARTTDSHRGGGGGSTSVSQSTCHVMDAAEARGSARVVGSAGVSSAGGGQVEGPMVVFTARGAA